mgnify:CR=1 FL=1
MLTPGEAQMFETWKGRRPVIVETIADCVRVLDAMTQDAVDLGKGRAF